MTVEQIAQVCHEANRAYCRTLGDESQPEWGDAPEWQRVSAMAGVELVLADPLRLPRESHEGWVAEKRAQGWRYGSVKDPEAKRHPCLVPYDHLPPEQRRKDHLFLAIARSLIRSI